MGSRCTIVIEGGSEPEAARAAAEAFDEIARIEQALSDYRPDSESMRVMRREPDRWHPVSEHLYRAMLISRDIHKTSGGAFDPTIGAVTHLWRQRVSPSRDAIQMGLSRVGFGHIQLHPDRPAIRFDRSGMILDFGGVGKGYAAQEAIHVLRALGFPVASVELGGDLALGEPPSNQPEGWRVEIVTGLSESRVVNLADCAVATSGDLERYIEYRGERYSHIIDPSTGFGIRERRAVTVIAEDASVADALASAGAVLGADRLGALCDAYPGARIEVVTRSIEDCS